MDGKIEIIDEEKKLARRVQPAPEEPVWFAMSAPYRREKKAQELLDSKGIDNYVAMHYETVVRRGIKKRVRVPVIHNLVFAHCTRSEIDAVKRGVPYLQFHTTRVEGKNVPIVVPDAQMEQFMKVCDTFDDDLRFFGPGEVNLAKGTKVRILEGQFKGVVGTFVRVAGSRSRRVVVEVPLVVYVATAYVAPEDLEILSE